MPPVTYDTSVFTSYKPEGFPSGFLFSAVVIQELMASANDDSEMNKWAATQRAFKKAEHYEDALEKWRDCTFEAALNWERRRQSRKGGA